MVGHPFDTIKVRLQTQDVIKPVFGSTPHLRYKGGWDCMMRTIRQEGFLALYKGMSGPMVTVPVVNAIVFAFYEQALSFFRAATKARQEAQALCRMDPWTEDGKRNPNGPAVSLTATSLADDGSASVMRPLPPPTLPVALPFAPSAPVSAAGYSAPSSNHVISSVHQLPTGSAVAPAATVAAGVDATIDPDDIPLHQISLAGGWAGLMNSVVVGPVELVCCDYSVTSCSALLPANHCGLTRCAQTISYCLWRFGSYVYRSSPDCKRSTRSVVANRSCVALCM